MLFKYMSCLTLLKIQSKSRIEGEETTFISNEPEWFFRISQYCYMCSKEHNFNLWQTLTQNIWLLSSAPTRIFDF